MVFQDNHVASLASRSTSRLGYSPVFRDRAKLVDRMLRSITFFGVDEAMVDVIIDQRALGAGNGVLDGLELLRDIDAWPTLFDHCGDTSQMAIRAIQSLDDRGMAGVSVMGHATLSHDSAHVSRNIPLGG